MDRVGTNHVCIPYQSFQSAIYEKRLEIFYDKLLVEEIVNLERNMENGKVDHPDGGSKDKSDAVCGTLYTASQHAEEFAYRYGETEAARLTLEVNDAGSVDDLSQLTVDFEEELKKISGMFNAASKNIKENPFSEKATEDYWLLNDNIIM